MREDFGLKSKKKTSQNNKKLKIDNGLNVVAVDEELINSKKKIKKPSEPKKDSGSVEEGKKCFEWLIHPEKSDTFFAETWEKKPKLIKRTDERQYFKHTFRWAQIIFT